MLATWMPAGMSPRKLTLSSLIIGLSPPISIAECTAMPASGFLLSSAGVGAEVCVFCVLENTQQPASAWLRRDIIPYVHGIVGYVALPTGVLKSRGLSRPAGSAIVVIGGHEARPQYLQ